MRRTILTFVVGVSVALTIAAGGQLTGGGGLTRVVLSASSTQLATGSGTTANPLLARLTLGTGLTGTGSAGSPLSASGGGGTISVTSPITGTGSAGSPVTLANADYGDVTVTGGTTWSIDSSAVTNAKMANMADQTVKANISGGAAAPSDVTLASFATALAIKVGVFGSGDDGSATLDGTATVTWASKSGSTYTMTRSAFPSSLTISTGSVLRPAGNVLRVAGTITLTGTAKIESNGTTATSNAGASALWTNQYLPTPLGGGNGNSSAGQPGSAGGPTSGAPQIADVTAAPGGTGTISTGGNGTAGGLGHGAGAGGGGGGDASHPGGPGGAGGAVTLAAANGGDFRDPPIAFTGRRPDATSFVSLGSGGAGGGCGGGLGVVGGGGGGGGGGGWMVVAALAFSGSGTVESKGGSGAVGSAAGAPAFGDPAGGGGGGGGGSGGLIVIILGGGSPPSTSVVGGSGGIGGVGAFGGATGGVGGSGGNGKVLVY